MTGTERTRDERIETCYQESAWDLAERLVDAEDAVARMQGAWRAAHYQVDFWRRMFRRECELTRELVVQLGARSQECTRYRDAWTSARRRAKRARQGNDAEVRWANGMWADALRDLHRYRCAWLSARRRAADAFIFGAEALALRDAEIERLKAQLRESTHGACPSTRTSKDLPPQP